MTSDTLPRGTGRLLTVLASEASPETRALVARLDGWTREDQAAATMIPHLLGAALARQDRVHGGGDDSLISAKHLAAQLQALYDNHLKRHCSGRVVKVRSSDLSKYRYGVTRRPTYPLALLFLIWLAEQLEAQRYHEDSQAPQLLAIFNPVQIIEAHVLAGEPLPDFEDADLSAPLLRGAMNRDIDAAERAVSEGLATLMGLERITSDLLRSDFFLPGETKACFLVYRLSTTRDRIVKGFLVVLPPTARASDAHQFNHYHETSAGEFRECRGFVLTLRNTHYFLGATGTRPPVEDGEPRRPLLREALKCVTVNRDYAAFDRNLWSGLFLSHDPTYRPIAGRCVLVRAKHQTWQDAQIGLLKSEDLGDDLKAYAHRQVLNRPAAKALRPEAILQAIDNSYEPPLEPGGHEHLRGPLGIVELPRG